MWHPLGSLFTRPAAIGWAEVDIRYVVQNYLQRELQADGVVCESVEAGRAIVRVSAPALVQHVRLLAFDVQNFVREQTGYELHDIAVQR
jgi:hypothetical protein